MSLVELDFPSRSQFLVTNVCIPRKPGLYVDTRMFAGSLSGSTFGAASRTLRCLCSALVKLSTTRSRGYPRLMK